MDEIEKKKCIFVLGCIVIGSFLTPIINKLYLVSFFLGGAFFTIVFDVLNKPKKEKKK